MKRFLIFFFLSLTALSGQTQQILDYYISEGLNSNIVLQQKNIALEQAMSQLSDAKSLFLPSVNFNGSYTSGQGGRYFNFPLGDIINPVYTTLNQLTQSNAFPQIENAEAYLNPKNFYDAHVRTSMPLVNSDLIYNKRIKEEQIVLKETEVDVYRRELVKNIKQAYYQYLSALDGVKVYESALALVQKNLKVNQSLLENGKGLPAQVVRAESEVQRVEADLTAAKSQVANAKHYFNFLINKPLDTEVDIAFDTQQALDASMMVLTAANAQSREELKLVQTGVNIRENALKLNEHVWLPKVSAFVDLGSQASQWKFNDKSRYYLLGAQVDIPIFNGLRNQRTTERARLDLKSSQLDQQLVQQQVELSIAIAKENFNAALAKKASAEQQFTSAQAYFRLVENGYAEGVYSQIEFVDARNQLTSAAILLSIQKYQVLSALAALERETAFYLLPSVKK